jgi:prolyl-tRNA synthetase
MYDVQFQNKNNKLELPYYMSAGMTTRTIGDIIMVHADDNGLVLPFKVAPTQIAILLLFCEQDKNIIKAGQDLAKKLDAFRTYIDTTNNSFGYKINEQEVSGTPFSIIIGPKDLANNSCMVYRRDLKTKSTIKLTELVETITKMHSEYDKNLYNKALEHLNSSIVEVSTFEEFVKAINDKKIVLAP